MDLNNPDVLTIITGLASSILTLLVVKWFPQLTNWWMFKRKSDDANQRKNTTLAKQGYERLIAAFDERVKALETEVKRVREDAHKETELLRQQAAAAAAAHHKCEVENAEIRKELHYTNLRLATAERKLERLAPSDSYVKDKGPPN